MEVYKKIRVPNNSYIIKKNNKKYYVYIGICDNILTKWITQSKWNGIYIQFYNDNFILYKDSKNKEILIYEDDENGWYNW